MAHRTTRSSARKKPAKPYADFPLGAHASGRWCKRIRGKLYYFGPWEDWRGALDRYRAVADDLYAGREPRPCDVGEPTLRDLANRFLEAKRVAVEQGDLTDRSWSEYHSEAKRLLECLGKNTPLSSLRPDDFLRLRSAMAKGVAGVTLMGRVRRVRTMMKWAGDNDLVDRPIRVGTEFKPPSRKALRRARASQPPKLFTAEELRLILKAAGEPLRTMVLLAINAGLGNHDVVRMKWSNVRGAWLDYPRTKTGVRRRAPLWRETREALDAWRERRPMPALPEHADLVFVTRFGGPFGVPESSKSNNPVSAEFGKLLDALVEDHPGIRQPRRGFYAIRHTFRTVGGDSGDEIATRFLMGHADESIDAAYREDVADERLRRVTQHVRRWLLGPKRRPK